MLVLLLLSCVTLVYIGSRRTERWRDARWWVLLVFSMGVTRISAGLVTLMLLPSAPLTSEETGDLIVTVGTGLLLAGGAWAINNRHRAKRDQEQQAAIHERQQTAPRPSPRP